MRAFVPSVVYDFIEKMDYIDKILIHNITVPRHILSYQG